MKKTLAYLLVAAVTVIAYQYFHAVHLYAQSTTTTRILVPWMNQQGAGAGYDLVLTIENTGMDPYSTTGASGTCSADVYYQGTHYGPTSLGTIAPGNSTLVSLATIASNVSLSMSSSTYAYLFVTCNFPYAHAQELLLNPSGDIVYFPTYIIPPDRSYSTGPEQLLQ